MVTAQIQHEIFVFPRRQLYLSKVQVPIKTTWIEHWRATNQTAPLIQVLMKSSRVVILANNKSQIRSLQISSGRNTSCFSIMLLNILFIDECFPVFALLLLRALGVSSLTGSSNGSLSRALSASPNRCSILISLISSS